jgi:hypothetical protein
VRKHLADGRGGEVVDGERLAGACLAVHKDRACRGEGGGMGGGGGRCWPG